MMNKVWVVAEVGKEGGLVEIVGSSNDEEYIEKVAKRLTEVAIKDNRGYFYEVHCVPYQQL